MHQDDDTLSFKERIARSVEKVHARELKEINKLQGKSKKNKTPEKDVAKDCLKWMRAQDWDVEIYEAKAVFNPDGTYRNSHMKAGVCDCMGIAPNGVPVYVEFKAKGARSTFNKDDNIRQQEFLLKKIDYFGFGVVVDSVYLLERYWSEFIRLKSGWGEIAAREYLLEQLPKKRKSSKKKSHSLDF